MAFFKASALSLFSESELMKSVGPTTPRLVFPLENGITHNQTSVSKISNEI
jgi:hypothetical protein